MAETPSADDVQKAIEKQIAELRKEMAGISRTLSDRAGEAYDDAATQAGRAARQVRRQAHAVSEAARDNPATTATLATAVGILGFAIGYVVGQNGGHGRKR